MIYDRLENINKYNFSLNFIINDLKSNQFDKGRCNINDNEEFRIDLTYNTQNEELGVWEAHRKYLDIHIILEGEEIICVSDINKMKSIKEYEEDYELFEGKCDHKILLTSGYFLVLFPYEVHKTSVIYKNVVQIKKKVYKKLLNIV